MKNKYKIHVTITKYNLRFSHTCMCQNLTEGIYIWLTGHLGHITDPVLLTYFQCYLNYFSYTSLFNMN
jgi:hypothetical protein